MEKRKIAVIGGGVGAITTAFAITQIPDWDKKYEVIVYQLGWRLGGKGASGRNARFGQRIEEHGLHVWAGFYDNAFRNMRACYEQLVTLGLRRPEDPLGTIDKAFKPLSYLFLAEHASCDDGAENPWRPWLINLPTNDRVPGTASSAPTPFEMMQHILSIVIDFLRGSATLRAQSEAAGIELPTALLPAHMAIELHLSGMSDDPIAHSAAQTNGLADLIRDAQACVHALETPQNMAIDTMRRGLLLADIALAYMRGTVLSDAFLSGYDLLDRFEFTDWLRQNGASEAALGSAIMRGCYDFVFGFPRGDVDRQGDVGAGTAIRAMSRLVFTYSGAIFQKMQAGMGDAIFAPYYQLLKAVGVRFEFFCAARDLHLDQSGRAIGAISMRRQAVVKAGEYDPLVDVKGVPCWPSEPLWDQLVDGAALRESGINFECEKEPPQGEPFELQQGRDFDIVLLGASLGSLPYMTGELAQASPRWSAMLDRVKTVGTHAAQLWLQKDAAALGWDERVAACNPAGIIPPSPLQTIIDGFAEPLDTWADMSHLLPHEEWEDDGPKMLAYFCAPASDGETLEELDARIDDWKNRNLVSLWPKAMRDGRFDNTLIHDGEAGFYRRVNMYGSERYVLSVANSVYYRLAPGESGFSNLFLAGDWTRCGLNAGCVEAATISGIAAASAITGEPLLNVGAEDVPGHQTVAQQALFLTNSVTSAGWPLTPFYARGQMSGWFCFYELPRDVVASMLPDGLTLGIAPMARPGFHPVGVSFCRYQNVRPSFLPGLLSMSPYGEATFAIPFTCTVDGGRAPFLYPRRLYVDNRMAIFAGRFFYAMDKIGARIHVDDTSFAATNDAGLSIKASFEQRSNAVPLSSHPAHGAISELLDLSFVTRRSSGNLLYNAFNLELGRAYVAPVSGKIEISDPSAGGFATGSFECMPLSPAWGDELPGAFRIWCSWSMTNPLDYTRTLNATRARSWVRQLD